MPRFCKWMSFISLSISGIEKIQCLSNPLNNQFSNKQHLPAKLRQYDHSNYCHFSGSILLLQHNI